jgi:TatD DNase family protein
MIIDTHIHLDDDRYRDDFEDVLKRAESEGVKRYIIPGADPKTLPRAVELSEKYSNIFFAVGVHPYDIDNYNRETLESYIQHPKCVAVGECGLDYYRLPKDKDEAKEIKEAQKRIFIDQIELANRYKKPLIVHIRDASLDSKEILERYSKYGGVLHCFNANESLIELANRGFYFGIGGVLTFKNAKKLVNVYPKLPLDKLLIETDGPYLTPHPFRGKRNEPAYCRLILNKMAQLSGIDVKKMEEITLNNTYNLFPLDI